MRVVATAGHVDHGKSTLVEALTGTDPDRFPEEKRRGLTIDLGFAFCTLPSGLEVGFVDVPGHSRFVKNMLAGVGAVDVAVLVVAANEGWKPQSEEHLRILDLLGIRHGVAVVTKADLVDAETLELAVLDVADHLAGSTCAGFEIVTCAARDGVGLDDVRAALDRAIAAAPAADDRDRPRLWVDRVFAARGAGTVVTGSLTGGGVAVGDDLLVAGTSVRVRGVEQHHATRDRAEPGERVALNLAGIDHDRITRGDALVRADQWRWVDVVDVALAVLPGVEVRPRSRLRAAVGSGEHPVWCRRLDERFARLRFSTPLPLAPGDRLVLRDPGAEATVAGAEVLDVMPVRRAADAPARLALPLGARVLADGWAPVAGLPARTGLAPAAAEAEVERFGERVGGWFVRTDVAASLRAALVDRVEREGPDAPGLANASLARELGIDAEQLDALVDATPELTSTGGAIHVVGRGRRAVDTGAGRAMVAALEAEPFAPPQPTDVALARALEREGALVESGGVWFAATAIDAAAARVVDALRARGALTIAEARDLLGSTRKYVVPIMSRLDATGVTRRRGDDRVPGPRSGLSPG